MFVPPGSIEDAYICTFIMCTKERRKGSSKEDVRPNLHRFCALADVMYTNLAGRDVTDGVVTVTFLDMKRAC